MVNSWVSKSNTFDGALYASLSIFYRPYMQKRSMKNFRIWTDIRVGQITPYTIFLFLGLNNIENKKTHRTKMKLNTI